MSHRICCNCLLKYKNDLTFSQFKNRTARYCGTTGILIICINIERPRALYYSIQVVRNSIYHGCRENELKIEMYIVQFGQINSTRIESADVLDAYKLYCKKSYLGTQTTLGYKIERDSLHCQYQILYCSTKNQLSKLKQVHTGVRKILYSSNKRQKLLTAYTS